MMEKGVSITRYQIYNYLKLLGKLQNLSDFFFFKFVHLQALGHFLHFSKTEDVSNYVPTKVHTIQMLMRILMDSKNITSKETHLINYNIIMIITFGMNICVAKKHYLLGCAGPCPTLAPKR